MSKTVPTKQHLRQVLLFLFNQKTNATQAHRFLIKVYPSHAPDIRLCQRWFSRFKTGDFDLGDKERLGPAKRFGDDELKALLEENPCQTQEELARILNVTQAAVSKRLKTLGMVQRKGYWMRKYSQPNSSVIVYARKNDDEGMQSHGICPKDMEIHEPSNRPVIRDQQLLRNENVLPIFKNGIVVEGRPSSKRRKRVKKV